MCSKAQVHGGFYKIPSMKFENRNMISYTGAVVFQVLFAAISPRATAECLVAVIEHAFGGMTAPKAPLLIRHGQGYACSKEE